MKAYHDLVALLLKEGKRRPNRTGVDTIGLFGHQMRFDLREGFPLLTTKRVPFRFVVHELLWFLRGDTHVAYLQENGVTIWDEWATDEQCAKFGRRAGDLGPIYGHQWRNFGATERDALVHAADPQARRRGLHYLNTDGVDQIEKVIRDIRTNPDSRRLIVTGWNPREAGQVALPPCHTLFQFYVQDGELSCHLYQRSADVFLGVPFNIASYALLTHMVAHVTGLRVGDFVHSFGDVHLYVNHLAQAELMLSRSERPLPDLYLDASVKEIDEFRIEDVCLEGYDPHPAIAADVAV